MNPITEILSQEIFNAEGFTVLSALKTVVKEWGEMREKERDADVPDSLELAIILQDALCQIEEELRVEKIADIMRGDCAAYTHLMSR